MYRVSSDGGSVQYVSRLGCVRTYTLDQWNQIWPKLLNRILG